MKGGANVLLYFGANLAPRLSTFVLLLVLTRLLPVDEYGLFALVVTTGEILDMAVGGWVRLFILSSDSGRDHPSAAQFGRTLVLTVVSCLVSLVGALVLAMVQPNLAGPFTLAVLVYVASFAILRLGLTLLQTRQSHRLYAGVEVGRAVLSLACAVGAEMTVGSTFLSASLGVSLATLLMGLIACGLAFRHMPWPSIPFDGYRAALAFGLPIVLVTLLGQVVSWLDRFILNHAMGPASVGLYAAAFALARQPVELFSGSLNPYTYPMLVRSYLNDGREAAGRIQAGTLLALLLLCGAVTIGVALLSQPFGALVLPEAYRLEATRVMPWIAVATFCTTLKNFCFDNVFYVMRKNWQQLVTMAPPTIVSVVFGLLLIPLGGPQAAAIVAAFSAFAALGGSAILSRRLLPFALPQRALIGLVVASGLGAAALVGARALLVGQPSLVILLGASAAFSAVYAGGLSLSGFSLRRMFDRPWEVWPDKAEAGQPVSASASC
ncbi:MAG: lipopolysaccharide biosynthesis protein [Pseudomonadota bacterium]